MGRSHRGQPLNGRQARTAGLIVLAVLAVDLRGSRGGDSTEQQPENGAVDPHVGSVAAYVPQGTRLATDLPEVEPSYLEPTPTQLPTQVATEPPAPVQAAATPVYRAPVYAAGVEQWRELVASIMPADTVERWLRVMACESGGNPNATGAAGELGLLQIMPYYHQAKADALFGAGANLYDPVVNVSVAYVISGGGYSFSAWTCKG